VAAEEAEAIAAVAVAFIAAEVVASMAVGVMAEVMASTAPPSLSVPAAGGMLTASASAGGEIGSIAVASDGSDTKFKRTGQPVRFFFLKTMPPRDESRPR
jgi:hypothetical protein